MKLQREIEVIITLLKAAIDEKAFRLGEREVDWEKIRKLLKYHGVTNMAYYGWLQMEDQERVPEEMQKVMEHEYEFAMAKEAHQYFALEEIRNVFEEKGVCFLPLKGCMLKYLYPSPDMRRMADMDIFYLEEQRETVDACMTGLGYRLTLTDETQDIYRKSTFLIIEMHKKLVKYEKAHVRYYDDMWKRVKRKEGTKSEYEMTLEDYYVYMLAHMAQHFLYSGTGIRSLVDFHVFQKKKGQELNRKIVEKELEAIRLREFETFLFEMDACVFGEKEWGDEALKEVFEYMVYSGNYGAMSHYHVNRIAEKKGAEKIAALGKIQYALSIVFLDRQRMELVYPWLKGRRYLLVPAWIYRIFSRLFFGEKEKMQDLLSADVEQEEVQRIRQIHKRAGLWE